MKRGKARLNVKAMLGAWGMRLVMMRWRASEVYGAGTRVMRLLGKDLKDKEK